MKPVNRQQLLIIVTSVVAAILVGERLVYAPLSALWKSRAETISKLDRQIKRGRATIASEPSIRAQWGQMRTNALPDNQGEAMNRISEKFRVWAEESSASLSAVSPPQWQEDNKDYKTVVCRVDVSGTLWMLARFIYDIESDPLGLKIESIEFSSRDNTGQQLSLGLQVSGLALGSPQP